MGLEGCSDDVSLRAVNSSWAETGRMSASLIPLKIVKSENEQRNEEPFYEALATSQVNSTLAGESDVDVLESGSFKSLTSKKLRESSKTSFSDRFISVTNFLTRRWNGHHTWIASIQTTPDGKFVVSGSFDNLVRVWNIENGELLSLIEHHDQCVSAVDVTPDGKRGISGSWDSTVAVWSMSTGKLQFTLAGHKGGVTSVTVTPDGKHCVSGSRDKTVKIWDINTGKEVSSLAGHKDTVISVAVSADGQFVASSSKDKTIKLWNLATAELVSTFEGHKDYVSSVRFSSDGTRLISGSWDKSVRIWDVHTKEAISVLEGHSEAITAVIFSPDERRIVSASWDKTIKIWDPESKVAVATLSGHKDWVKAVRFTPNGKIVSGASDNTIRIWDPANEVLLRTVKKVRNPNSWYNTWYAEKDINGTRTITKAGFFYSRSIFLAYSALSGVAVVLFAWLCTECTDAFQTMLKRWWWWPLWWTPAVTVIVKYVAQTYAPGSEGSGIPQTIASLNPRVSRENKHLYVSPRLTFWKILLVACGQLAGLTVGRQGPSVQVGAGIMRSAKNWIPSDCISENVLIVAGGAAGFATAFNTPLSGILFAMETMGRVMLQGGKNYQIVVSAIVFSAVVTIALRGNTVWFGSIVPDSFKNEYIIPALLMCIFGGLFGGLFSKCIVWGLAKRDDFFSTFRRTHPLVFAGVCGFIVGGIGVLCSGDSFKNLFGSGYKYKLEKVSVGYEYFPLKFISAVLSTLSGVPAGIFVPSLSIGEGMATTILRILKQEELNSIVIQGIVSFLAAATQAPLTSFIIVMEMTEGNQFVVLLMSSAIAAAYISKQIVDPLYFALARNNLNRMDPFQRTRE
jgi:WD40 repeat protein